MNKLIYYSDFVLYPIVFLLIANTADGLAWWGEAAAGTLLFTFLEYWTHRSFLHGIYWHGQHERHHLYPEEYTILPWYLVPLVMLVALLILPLPIFAGFTLGYVWFIMWHDALHHWNLSKRPWIARYASWHNEHHKGNPCNYGITHPLWDRLFGTYQHAV